MDRQDHILVSLAEECNEIAHRISKALRFGLSEVQAGQELTNAERIQEEINDFLGIYRIAFREGILPGVNDKKAEKKIEKFEEFLKLAESEDRLIIT